ncbi:MAG: hypothetical protein ACI8XC_001570, partial [Gammaproteobacteria bacterium]
MIIEHLQKFIGKICHSNPWDFGTNSLKLLKTRAIVSLHPYR